MKILLVTVLVLVLVAGVGVGAYAAGQSAGFAEAQNIRAEFFQNRLNNSTAQGSDMGMPQMQGQRGQARGTVTAPDFVRAGTSGVVKSVDGNKLVITTRDGSTITVTMDNQTVIQKITLGSQSDLKAGDNITVMSSQTGSNITAQMIQIRPGGQ